MKDLKECLKNIQLSHVFAIACLKYIQPDIKLLNENDIFEAEKLVSDITTKLNWGIGLEETLKNKQIINIAQNISEEEEIKYFKQLYKHFNIE